MAKKIPGSKFLTAKQIQLWNRNHCDLYYKVEFVFVKSAKCLTFPSMARAASLL